MMVGGGGAALIGLIAIRALQDNPHDSIVLVFALAIAVILFLGGIIGFIRNWP